jgi:hypothetical protein
MTTPRITRCPDGHFRRVIYSIGPFIADYPEQVYLTGIVQGRCPKYIHFLLLFKSYVLSWLRCRASTESLSPGEPRFRELTQCIKDTYSHDPDLMWDAFGIAPGVTVILKTIQSIFDAYSTLQPFTDYFPRADIHELISPDILHQVIKGTFKDHLVEWVLNYIKTHHSAHEAHIQIDELDRR